VSFSQILLRTQELRRFIFGITEGINATFRTFRRARHTKRAAVQNDTVCEDDPLILGDDLDQVLLDLDRVGFPGEVEACGDALHMSVDHHSGGDVVGRAQHHIGSLSGGAGNGEEFLHGPWHLTAEFRDYFLRRAHNRFRLVIEKSGGADVLRQHLRRDGGEILRRGILGEQPGSNFVHPLIGALRRENSGHEQFPRVRVVQGTDGIGIHFRQHREDLGNSGLTFGCGLGPFPVSSYLDMRARLLLCAAALAAFGGSLIGGFHLDDYAIFQGAGPRAFAWPHPLTQVLTWLNYRLAGQEAVWYHAVNLLLHVGAVLLAYECLRRLLPTSAALMAAGIFAVNPWQAETVDYVSARAAMVVAIVAFTALLTGLAGRRWIAWALAAVSVAEAAAYQRAYPYAILRLFVAPWGFTIQPHAHEPLWLLAAAIIAVLGVTASSWRKLGTRSAASWALIGLALLVSNATAYLALFALAAAAGLLLARIPARAAGVAVMVILAAVSVRRTYVWNSDERLWREAVRQAPERVEPKIQFAKYLRAADALELLNRAREQAHYNAEIPAEIGKVLLDEQQYEAAVDELSQAVALDPRNALAFNNRGVALAALGQIPAAAADFEHALALDPHLAEARENLKRLGAR